MEQFLVIIFYLAILFMSVVVHEFAHGWMALYLGDPTARNLGRLTLNPLKHLDPVGSFLVPILLYISSGGTMTFGWAKPVPYNPYRLRDARYGEAKVAIAGPMANLLVAVVLGLCIRFGVPLGLVPVAMVDLLKLIVFLNIALATFNLVPIPPLDGSKIFFAFLPAHLGEVRYYMERYGILFLILFIMFAADLIFPVINLVYNLIVVF